MVVVAKMSQDTAIVPWKEPCNGNAHELSGVWPGGVVPSVTGEGGVWVHGQSGRNMPLGSATAGLVGLEPQGPSSVRVERVEERITVFCGTRPRG